MQPLWTPSPERVSATRAQQLIHQLGLDDFNTLHRFSVDQPADFWREAWDFCGVVGTPGDVTIVEADMMRHTRYFPDARLNVVDTLLARRDDGPAMMFHSETGDVVEVSWSDLHDQVSRFQQILLELGIEAGDRVAAMMVNAPDIYALMLASAGLGAVFSSVSPDFGASGVVDRFGQIEPSALFVSDGYWYGGKWFSCLGKIDDLRAGLSSVGAMVIVPFGEEIEGDVPGGALDGSAMLARFDAQDVRTDPLPFDHPWYVLYSSGTTGKPKCIVHRTGGVLLKHLVEQQLHCDIRRDDRVFYFTTAGWMMWNWLASVLGSGACLVLYDGSPFYPDERRVFDVVEQSQATLMGISAKFVDACAKAELRPADTHDLSAVRTICSTGSTLVPEGFDYVYDHIKADVHLQSMSGGTDLCGCLVAGDPTGAVYRGEIQCSGLGMAIEVIDDAGRPLGPGVQGELTCSAPFPSMPLRFWDDPGDERYERTYFERFPGHWHQGDFAEWTEAGGMVIHGRSDATLNPGGVRIGTAEIYRQVDAISAVLESLVIGQQWEGDTRIVLFVRLVDGVELNHDLQAIIRARIRQGASPRHMPAVIVAVADLPRTRSGKLTELAVRDIVHGRPVNNAGALANPEALNLFVDLPELA